MKYGRKELGTVRGKSTFYNLPLPPLYSRLAEGYPVQCLREAARGP